MTTTLCETCGRRPSERHALAVGAHVEGSNCPDPVHQLADDAPALAEALEKLLSRVDSHFGGTDRSQDWKEQAAARALVGQPEINLMDALKESLEITVHDGETFREALAKSRAAKEAAAREGSARDE